MRLIDSEDVAGYVIERTGAIIQMEPRGKGDYHKIAIQLVRDNSGERLYNDDYQLDICLSEIGVIIDERWEPTNE